MTLSVRFQQGTLSVPLGPENTVAELQQHLETQTGLVARKQKIMSSGKVISGRAGTLAAAGVKPGAKLMLLAAAGTASQGANALEAARLGRQQALERGRQQLTDQARQRGIAVASASAAAASSVAASMAQRAASWAKTGIAALRDLKLTQLPPELFDPSTAPCIRVLDCGGNALTSLPQCISQLTALQRLRLSINRLADDGMPWQLLAGLSQLVVLAADDNCLTTVPECVSGLTRLQKLSLNGNKIASLPSTMSGLQHLWVLSLRGNQLPALPPALGSCSQLEELDVRDNQLAALPAELGQLSSLKALFADNNRLRTVPPALLSGCPALATLSLHGNPLTAEELREVPGWLQFDERRRTKYDKQVGMKVLSGGFDEGADINSFEHWNT
ncbi:hypothetical protein D9Q98_003687 [Chlorella vulgaris]|uniref:Ubiquitin-like domain-containing protein n=1 Tax=Chlorella vulgaris TaxID=3077 RepID=A0A9D4TUH7_CHLVU|nr:hypothetical protein D9Q98_003687 [Chlorella vulgaris]